MGQAITSLEGFTRKIRKVTPRIDEVLLYRGHPDWKYKLIPSVLRKPILKENEHIILRELVAGHPDDFATDTTTLEQLVRVQHYSAPTRLLDATWNPLVALYFASKEGPNIDGEVIVFRINNSLVKYFDSDTVCCVANLANLNHYQKTAIDFTVTGNNFNSQSSIDRLLQFIKAEKPHFRSEINPAHLQTVLCVKPKQNNRRILAQSGAFLIFGIIQEILNGSVPGIALERIRINKLNKGDIITELDRVSVNESTMFPEIEKAASYITSKL
jgi:FRG domain